MSLPVSQPVPTVENMNDLARRIADLRDVVGILDVRLKMETEAVRLAALRRSDAHVAALAQALADMRDAFEAGQSTVEADHRFHRLIAESTGNPLFVNLLNHLGRRAIPRTRLDTPGPDPVAALDYLNRLNLEHEAIYDAIAQRDVQAAGKAMYLHLVRSRDRLREAQMRLEKELSERNRSGLMPPQEERV
jgi:DNA-binding FadR family transcriptional regulator